MQRQRSQASMRVARQIASLLWSHRKGLGPQDALKRDSRGLSRVVAGKTFPSTSAGDLRELPRVSLRVEGYCGVGGASQDSAGFVAMEEGLISKGGRNLRLPLRFGSDRRVPAELGQESHASSCLRKGTPLASRVVRRFQAPGRALCGTRGSFRMMHGGVSVPSCCAFTHRVAFKEGSGPRVLLKSGPGNRGHLACGTTHVARLEFPCETGLILRCTGKAGNPF